MNRRARYILPLLLLVSLTGCLHAPASPQERRTGVDLVGTHDSAAPIRVGVSTRAQVIQTLGQPATFSADGRAIAYSYKPITGRLGFVFFGGPCGLCGYYPFEMRVQECLWLGFDQDGRLKSYASSREKSHNDWRIFSAMASSPP